MADLKIYSEEQRSPLRLQQVTFTPEDRQCIKKLANIERIVRTEWPILGYIKN